MDNGVPFDLVLAKGNSKTEARIQWRGMVAVGTEAKGVENSQYECLLQGFQISNWWRCCYAFVEMRTQNRTRSCSNCSQLQ